MKAITISCINLKGGVGKTTTVTNVAAALRDKGFKVLVIDLDPQANLSKTLTGDQVENSVGDLLFGQSDFEETVIKTSINIDLIPATLELSTYERNLTGLKNYHSYLKKALKGAMTEYDFILIDCSPSLSNLSVNALTASNYYLIPVLLDSYSIDGIKNIASTAAKVQQLNDQLDILGVMVSRYNTNDKKIFDKQVYEQLQETLGDKMFNTTIRQDQALKECVVHNQDIFTYSQTSRGAQDYLSLTLEILERVKKGGE